MHRKGCSLVSLAVISVLLVCAGRARAAGREAKERAARKACLSGEVSKGVQLLADLYLDTMDATYIFNQGRCFEQNHRYEDAISRFREQLLKQPDMPESDKAATRIHILTCQGFLGKKPESVQPEVAAAVVAAAPPPPAAAPAPVPDAVVQAPAAGVPSGEAGSGLRTAGVVTAVIGGGALVAGLAFNLKANSLATDAQAHYDPSKASSHSTYVTLGWIAYGAGAACLAGGAVLYFLGWRAGHQTGKVVLVPTVSSGVAGLALTGPL